MDNSINEKEKVIKIFEDYFKDVKKNYDVSEETIKYLKKKVRKEVEKVIMYE